MIRSFALCTVAGAALLGACLGAQASTVVLSGYTYGNGNNVAVTAPNYNGSAGGFSGTLSGFGGFDGAINSYCVDLLESFSFGTSYTDYSLVSAASQFTAAKVTALGKLISYVYGNNLIGSTGAAYKDDLSTAVQVAIWNIVYDTDFTLDSGTFKDSSIYKSGTANFMGANALLSNSQLASQSISYSLNVLRSVGNPGHQDQLIWRAVPEPASSALVLLALGAAGCVTRRRPHSA